MAERNTSGSVAARFGHDAEICVIVETCSTRRRKTARDNIRRQTLGKSQASCHSSVRSWTLDTLYRVHRHNSVLPMQFETEFA
jgi:hypothetical protein